MAALAAGTCVLAILLPGCGPDYQAEACDAFTRIANDKHKRKHVRDWISARLADPAFRQTLRKRNVLGPGDERFEKFGALDWNYLGLAEPRVSVGFNMEPGKDGWWDSDQIHSVDLDLYRTTLYFQVGSRENLWRGWPEEFKAHLYDAGEGVFVACNDYSAPD